MCNKIFVKVVIMKTNKPVKFLTIALSLTLLLLAMAGCSSGSDDNVLKVGVSAGPYEDMFREAIEPTLLEKGYSVEYVQFSDYVQPNKALADGEINLNIFQHSVYLRNFSDEHNLDLAYITEIPTAGMGVFSANFDSVNDIPNGAMVAIPNDVTNLARAIRVLEQAGLATIVLSDRLLFT